MANSFEAQLAAKLHMDAARVVGHEVGEENDDPAALAMEAWAEEMVKRGAADRRTALRCAEVVWALQAAKDRECAGAVVYAGEVPRSDALLEGVRLIAIKIYQAHKRGMEAGALILATGSTHGDFESARDLAAAQGVSHELAANAVEDWQRALGLPPTAAQKSAEAKESYKNTNGKLGRKAA